MPKKKNSSVTVNVDAVKRDVKKMVDSYDPRPQKNISQPSISRQSPLEQEMGSRRYREMIHDHNKKNGDILDKLPFTFPKKKAVRSNQNVPLECQNCLEISWGTEFTIGAVCSFCKKYSRVKNLEAEKMGHDPDVNVGFRGTAEDLVASKR